MKIILISFFLLSITLAFLFPFFQGFSPPYSIKICDEMFMEESKIMCYALFLKNLEYCYLLPTPSFCIDYVFSALELNESFCLSFDNYERLSCVIALSVKTRNPYYCELLNETKQNCYFELTSFLDTFEINENFCRKIREESLRFTCLAKVKNDLKICDKIKFEPFEIPNCKAIISKDEKYCKDAPSHDFCLELIALETQNKRYCESIRNGFYRSNCLMRIEGKIDYCKQIKSSWRDLCILSFFHLRNLGVI